MLRACVDFCKDSEAWRLEKRIVLPQGIDSTKVSTPKDSVIYKIRSLAGDDGLLGLISSKQSAVLRRRYKDGYPLFYYLTGANRLKYWPVDTGNSFFDVELVLAPKVTATEIDDDLVDLYLPSIEAKAIADAMLSPGSPAHNPREGMVWLQRYQMGVDEARDREDQNLSGRTVATGYGGI